MKKHYEISYGKDSAIYFMDGTTDNFTLGASQFDKGWSTPGQKFARLLDTGNGIVIKLEQRIIQLNYCEAEQLRLMLKLNNPEGKLYEITKKVIK